MKVRLLWWSSVTGDASRGNQQAFENIGLETELVNMGFQDYHLRENADFLFTGMIYEAVNWYLQGKIGLPIIIQGGGYGPNLLPNGKLNRFFERVTEIPKSLVTILDSKYYYEMLNSGLPFDFEKIFIVPNGVPSYLKDFPILPKKKKRKDEFIVFNPMGTFWIKQPERFIEVVKTVNKENLPIKFVMPMKTQFVYNCPIEWLEIPNLELLPVQSFPQMCIWYQKCDLVAVYSQAEIFPQHFFEALWFGKPLIHNNAGLIQTVSIDLLKDIIKDFGINCMDFDKKWSHAYHTGGHFLDAYGFTEKDFADAILDFYVNEELRNECAKLGKKWVSNFWSMTDKARLLVEMMKERGYI